MEMRIFLDTRRDHEMKVASDDSSYGIDAQICVYILHFEEYNFAII